MKNTILMADYAGEDSGGIVESRVAKLFLRSIQDANFVGMSLQMLCTFSCDARLLRCHQRYSEATNKKVHAQNLHQSQKWI